jgi:hypothetical protein
LPVQRNRANRVVRDGGGEKIGFFFGGVRLKFPQPLNLSWDDQVFVPAQGDAVLGRELLRSFSNEVNMRTITENPAGGPHRVAQMLHAAHTSGAKRGAVHDQGIELYFALAIQKAASASVKSFVIFHDDNRFFNGIEGASTAAEYPPASSDRIAYAVEMCLDHVVGNSPGSAMDKNNRIDRQDAPQEMTG